MGSFASLMKPWWTQILSRQSAEMMAMLPGRTSISLTQPFSPCTVKVYVSETSLKYMFFINIPF